MELNFVRTEAKMNLYGKDYKLVIPSMDEVLDFEYKRDEAVASADGEALKKVLKSYLKDRGIPGDVYKKIERPHVIEIINALNSGKKN